MSTSFGLVGWYGDVYVETASSRFRGVELVEPEVRVASRDVDGVLVSEIGVVKSCSKEGAYIGFCVLSNRDSYGLQL